MKFLLFHGAFGRPESNWFPELKDKLESLGQEVIAPRFPVDSWDDVTRNGPSAPPKHQSLENWLAAFEDVRKPLQGKKLCFIGHSLGPLFILHVVERYNIKLDCAFFVSPFLDKLNRSWQIDHVNQSFYKTDFDFGKLKKLIPISYVLYSDNDPYVDKNHSVFFAKSLDSSLIFVKKAGHMNSEVNLNEFPLVLDLCLTRLDLSLYQRYLEHRRQLYSLEYVKSKPEGVIKLDPKEIIDEGMFHFRNLRHQGFCTFFTRLVGWDPKGKYSEEARAAAGRVKNFSRVFVVDKPGDLKRPEIREQVRLDLAAGVQVYLCPYAKIKGAVPFPDFGIWDDEYVCIIDIDENTGKMKDIELNSTREGLQEASQWKSEVFKHAVRVHTLKDLNDTRS